MDDISPYPIRIAKFYGNPSDIGFPHLIAVVKCGEDSYLVTRDSIYVPDCGIRMISHERSEVRAIGTAQVMADQARLHEAVVYLPCKG